MKEWNSSSVSDRPRKMSNCNQVNFQILIVLRPSQLSWPVPFLLEKQSLFWGNIFCVFYTTQMLHLTITCTWCVTLHLPCHRVLPFVLLHHHASLHTNSLYLSLSLSLPLHLSSLHVIKHSCGMGIALSVPLLLFSSLSIFRAASNASCKSLVT